MATDPVCGMEVDPQEAAATSVYGSATYYFCAPACKERFDRDADAYLHRAAACERKSLLERLFGG